MKAVELGDIVTVVDKAWSICYNRKPDVGRIRRHGLSGQLFTFKVIGIDCKLKTKDAWTASTLIRNTETGAIWAINASNLQVWEPVKVVFMMGSVDITASLTNAQKYTLIVDFIGRER